MTRETCAQELRVALERLGVREGRIGLPILWPAIAGWWASHITDLTPVQDDDLAFLLSLSPARRDEHHTVFAGDLPPALAGRDLVCLEFERSFAIRTGPESRRVIGGGAGMAFWYEYGPAWRRLRERTTWIEMGFSTPQLDAFASGREAAQLIRYVEQDSGVMDAADEHALAFEFGSRDEDDQFLVVAHNAP